jgi:hypothetical protein
VTDAERLDFLEHRIREARYVKLFGWWSGPIEPDGYNVMDESDEGDGSPMDEFKDIREAIDAYAERVAPISGLVLMASDDWRKRAPKERALVEAWAPIIQREAIIDLLDRLLGGGDFDLRDDPIDAAAQILTGWKRGDRPGPATPPEAEAK